MSSGSKNAKVHGEKKTALRKYTILSRTKTKDPGHIRKPSKRRNSLAITRICPEKI